jgi:histone deacetylase complex regulatory component SIN3
VPHYTTNFESSFVDEPDVSRKFQAITEDFKNQVIDVPQLLRRVADLLNATARVELYNAVIRLLPRGYSVDLLREGTLNANIEMNRSQPLRNSILEWAHSVDPDQMERDVGVPEDEEGTVGMDSSANKTDTVRRPAGPTRPAKRQRTS